MKTGLGSRLFATLGARLGSRGLLALGLVVALLPVPVGFGPWSPFALDRVHSRLAAGDVRGAAEVCERVTRFGSTPGIRRRARYELALLQATNLGRPQEALDTLHSLLGHLPPGHPLESDALKLLAETLPRATDRQDLAAQSWEMAARRVADPDRRDPLLLAAANAWEDAGEASRARLVRGRVATGGGTAEARAWLAIGRTWLGDGQPARAYEAYRQGLDRSASDADARMARLGMALALDELGSADEAAAELEVAQQEEGLDAALEVTRKRVMRRAGIGEGP
ncbi:MAG: tetratricopeptide repeat protein [Deltaproteobacteria bacterium]|nr:tetratricopeptide repeat protein [Deltaproteobacteria bacterium]